MFVTPGEVFDAVKVSPVRATNWVVPALILMLVSWIGTYFVFSQDTIRHQMSEIADKSIQKTIEKKNIPKEQADKMREVAEKYGSMGPMIGAAVMPVIFGFGMPLFWGFIQWIIAGKVFHADYAYMKWVEVTGLGNIIGVLDGIVRTLLIMVTGSIFAAPGPILFIKDFDPNSNLHQFLMLINVMTIWILAVRSVGFARLSGISLGKAVAWVFGIWAAYTGVFYGLGAASRAAFGG
jgi:hypothetical protein